MTNGRGISCLDGSEDVVTEMQYPILGLIRIESCDHFLADAQASSSLLPLWEKVAWTQSAPDEGSLSAETDPSPVRDAAP
jgi:hypothetical protein